MIKSKKAISAIIETILLVGLAVTTAVFVFTWSKGYTKELTEQSINFAEGKLECAEIFINILPKESCSILNITNKGRLPISQIAIRILNGDDDVIETKVERISLSADPEKNNIEIAGLSTGEKVEVIPVVKIKNELVGCKEKRIIKECSTTGSSESRSM